ncbi:FecR domain-containing protein [Chitinophaga sp. 30R24]|uniref:FecR domain-containing protein n=1 Tax=Chitinophaga sp. 30R24 TaxID=3248838 RepID=UPI003B9076F6
MYQPEQDITDLVSVFIQFPQDPLLQDRVAALVATGPEQAAYVEGQLLGWLQAGTPVTVMATLPPGPLKPLYARKSANVCITGRKWIAVAITAAVLVIITGVYVYLNRLPDKLLLYTNRTGHIDTLLPGKGCRIIANKQAVIGYGVAAGGTPVLSMESGDAWFDMDGKARMRMQLDERTVLCAREAVFNVHKTPSLFRVFVVSGKVLLKPDRGHQTTLMAHMMGKKELHHPLQQKSYRSQSPLAWKTGLLQFQDIPLEEVLDAVNSYYGIEIQVLPSAGKLLQQKITANFGQKTAAEVLLVLHQLLQAPIVKNSGNQYYITLR